MAAELRSSAARSIDAARCCAALSVAAELRSAASSVGVATAHRGR